MVVTSPSPCLPMKPGETIVRIKLFLSTALMMLIMSVPGWAQVPTCLRTDTPSTPTTGGEGGNGGYVTIYGKNLGSTGTVTVGGEAAAQILLWNPDFNSIGSGAIGIQIAAGTPAGAIVVTTATGSCSNLTWAPRTGKIYFIGPVADNSSMPSCSSLLAANSYSAPWGLTSGTVADQSGVSARTPYSYYNCISVGDTLVFLNGVKYTTFDGRGWHAALTVDKSGTSATNFNEIIARPGASVQIGGTTMYGLRNAGKSTYSVYSGITFVGATTAGGIAVATGNYDTTIGNVLECPTCGGEAGGGFDGTEGGALGTKVLFNAFTEIATSNAPSNKQFHCAYMGAGNFEIGWNRFYNNSCYNGIQVNEDGVTGFGNFSIHGNDIADVNGAGINMATVNPAAGPISIVDNIIHHTGVQRASDGGEGDFHSAISDPEYQTGTSSGTIEITNNTVYDCSSILNTYSSGENESGCFTFNTGQSGVTFNLENNLVIQPAYSFTSNYNPYFGSTAGTVTGSNNLFSSGATPGSTAPASSLTNLPIPTNPGISTAADGPWTNFELTAGSAAIGAGKYDGNTPAVDFVEFTRPNPPSIGALELQGSAQQPTMYALTITPPTNGTIGGSTAGSYEASTPLSFTINPASGYQTGTVTGCGGVTNGSNYAVTMPANICTVAATFTAMAAPTYALTVTATPSVDGSVSGTGAGSYAQGTSITETAVPVSGYQVAWSGCASGTGATVTFAMPANACSEVATFTAIAAPTYALTVTATPSADGSVTGTGAGSYAQGTSITETAVPVSGYQVGWSGCASGTSATVTFTMPANACSEVATFTAKAAPTYALTVTATPSADGSVSGTGAGSYAQGTTITETASPVSGFQVTWSGCASGTGTTVTFAMPANACSEVATFTAKAAPAYAFASTATPAADGSVSGTGAGNYPQGTSITESAVPASGFQVTWSGCASGTGAIITFAMPANACTETATFSPSVAAGTITPVGTPVCSHNFNGKSGFVQYTPKAIGDTLVIGVSLESSSVAVNSISDGYNTYPSAFSTEVGNGYTSKIYGVLSNKTLSPLTISTAYSKSVYDTVCVSEYKGAVAFGTAAGSTGLTAPYSVILTPHEANNVVVIQVTSYGAGSGVATKGTIRAQSNDDLGGLIQDNTGSLSPITVSGSGVSNYHWAAAALELRTQ